MRSWPAPELRARQGLRLGGSIVNGQRCVGYGSSRLRDGKKRESGTVRGMRHAEADPPGSRAGQNFGWWLPRWVEDPSMRDRLTENGKRGTRQRGHSEHGGDATSLGEIRPGYEDAITGVSWLSDHRSPRLPAPSGPWLMRVATRLQWRDRAGFTPASSFVIALLSGLLHASGPGHVTGPDAVRVQLRFDSARLTTCG